MRGDRRGVTGIADVMIFLAVMGLAFAGLCACGIGAETDDRDAAAILDGLLASELRTDDIADAGESRIAGIADILAYAAFTGDVRTAAYLDAVLEAVGGGPGSIRIELDYLGRGLSAGGPCDGPPRTVCKRTVPVSYGGELSIELQLR